MELQCIDSRLNEKFEGSLRILKETTLFELYSSLNCFAGNRMFSLKCFFV